MEEILTQEEINALLSGIGAEQEEAEQKIRMGIRKIVSPFDFRSPDKFSKAQMRTLEMLHEVFAQRLSVSLSTYLRTPVRVNLKLVEQLTFDDFIGLIPTPAVMVTFTLEPLQGACLLEIKPNLALSMIDRLLGGPGNFEGKPRELTEMEQLLIEKLAVRMLANLGEAWSHLAELVPRVDGIHMNPQFVQIISPKDAVSVLNFDLSLPKTTGSMSLCFPYLTLQPMAEQLSTRQWFSEKKGNLDSVQRAQLQKRLQFVRLPVKVEIGGASLTARELLELKVGDIIKLDTRPDQDLRIYIGTFPKFLGKAGLSGRRLAVKITAISQ